MKVYMVTQAEMDALRERLELTKLRHQDGRGIHDPERQDLNDMHRYFNYEICHWINEVSK
jgi:hypothetical protein